MRQVKRIRFLTENYNGLQGLRFVPLGVCFLLGAIYDAGPGEWRLFLGPAVGGLILVSVALYFVIGRYYGSSFGYVTPSESRARMDDQLAALWIGVFGVYFVLIIINVTTQMEYRVFIGLLGALLIASAALTYLRMRGLPRYFPLGLIFVLLLLSTGQVPAITSGCSGDLLNQCAVEDVLIGTVLTVGGVLNHLLLTRNLSAVREGEGGGAV